MWQNIQILPKRCLFIFCIFVKWIGVNPRIMSAYAMKFFFHRWVNFSFDSFLSTFNMCLQMRNVNEIFQSAIIKVFQKKKFLPDFWWNFFFWNTFFTNQRSNFYWKWRKWLMWDEHERRNEWKFKNIRIKRKQRKIRITIQIIKRKLGRIVIGGNFFIISKIINLVTSQFLNERI